MSNMPKPDTALTAIEERVVDLLAQGMTVGAVARELFLTENTIRKHVQRACVRTGTRGRAHLVAVVVRRRALEERLPPAATAALVERERKRSARLEELLTQARRERDEYRRGLRRVARMAEKLEAGEGEGES